MLSIKLGIPALINHNFFSGRMYLTLISLQCSRIYEVKNVSKRVNLYFSSHDLQSLLYNGAHGCHKNLFIAFLPPAEKCPEGSLWAPQGCGRTELAAARSPQ